MTVLHDAVESGNMEIAKFLVEKGADVNAKGYSGRSVLYGAAHSGNPKLIQWLKARGVQE